MLGSGERQEGELFGRRNEPIEEAAPDDEPGSAEEVQVEDTAAAPDVVPAEAPADGQNEESPIADVVDEVGLEETGGDRAQRLAEELELVTDRHLRLAAEFENFRKRTRREQAELSVMAQAEFARRLLPTLDDLARVSSTPPETTTVQDLDAGLDLILRNLRKELEEAGLTRIDALGERFNPEFHQGILTADTTDRDLDDTVSRVFVDGYVFRDRLVRPAQVEVMSYSAEGPEDA
jgi:molecular chaperone GrpE